MKRLALLFWAPLALAGCAHLYGYPTDNANPPSEVRWAKTDDGWLIPLYHYPPSATVAGRDPVVLCHGLGANRFNMDVSPSLSLARYLADHGWDAWIMEVRGVGNSRRVEGGKSWDFTFDDFVTRDLPAVFREVRRATGAPRVNWVGHSMGGMVLYAYLATGDQTQLGRCVAAASPGTFEFMGGPFRPLGRLADWLPRGGHFPASSLAPMLLPFFTTSRMTEELRRVLTLAGNPDNFPMDALRRMGAAGIGDTSNRVYRQFGDWVAHGSFTSEDHKVDYRSGMRRIDRPFLFLAGRWDELVSPAAVLQGYNEIASREKKYHLFGRANGDQADYGHGDLILGRASVEEVYPEIEAFLRGTKSP